MPRPVFFNPIQIQLPVGALTSIAHRISGLVLAIGLPLGVYLLHLSLRDAEAFAWVSALFDHWAIKLVAIGFVWALSHHILAGVRHLLSDVDIGSTLSASRRSAFLVNIGGAAVALLAAGALW